MNERELLKMFANAVNHTILISNLPIKTKLSDWELRHLINPLLNEKLIIYDNGVTNVHGFTSYSEYVLSNAGSERLKELERTERSYRFNEWRAWITLAIAVVSLVIAIFATVLTIVLG